MTVYSLIIFNLKPPHVFEIEMNDQVELMEQYSVIKQLGFVYIVERYPCGGGQVWGIRGHMKKKLEDMPDDKWSFTKARFRLVD